jgi:hypothetical protein
MLAPWVTWWQDDLPCQFSRERACENCAYLLDAFGESWVDQGMAKAGRGNHPLRRRWSNNGANSFLELNGLAEDLRIIDSVPGIDALVEELKNSEKSEPARHVIRCAALFGRDKNIRILEFPAQKSATIPDFFLGLNGSSLAVEAKLLSESSEEKMFEEYADMLVRQIFTHVVGAIAIYPQISVIIKNSNALPDPHESGICNLATAE